MSLRIYFAAPLFSEAERAFNIGLVRELEHTSSVYLPQRDGSLIVDLLKSGMPLAEARAVIFRQDFAALRNADLVLAILDGRTVDEGVAIELGLAFGLGKPCWSLKTDFRSLAYFGDNPMVEALISRGFSDRDSLLAEVRELSRNVQYSLGSTAS